MMGPLSEHIHMHDSFGIIERIWTHIDAENTSYGQGDLHLPLGWGDIPFDKIFDEVHFPKNINLNFELPFRYEKYYKENIKEKGDQWIETDKIPVICTICGEKIEGL